nr:coatomer subunit delta [Quercus suber]
MSISGGGCFGSGSGFGLSIDIESFSTKSKDHPPSPTTVSPKGLGMSLGTLALQILNQEDGCIQVQIETGGNLGILFKTHPNMNIELFSNENI